MANTTSEFEILIKTKLADQGITATDEQVKSLADSLRETGETGEKAHEKLTEGAHKTELSHRELRESLHALLNQFGEFSEVGLLLNPITAALAAMLFIVDKLKEYFKNAAEAVLQLAEETDKINEARIKGFADAANDAAGAIQSMAIEQEKLNTAYAQSSTAMDNRVKQYSAERDAVLKVAEAKQGAFEAEIHYETELGRISKERADAVIAQSKLQLDAQRGAADSAKLGMEIEERRQELDKASFRLRTGSDEERFRTSKSAEAPLAGAVAASEEAAKQAATGKFQDTYRSLTDADETFSGTTDDLKKQIAVLRDKQKDAEINGNDRDASGYKYTADQFQIMLARQEKYVENLNRAAEIDKQKLSAAKAQTDQYAEQLRHDQEIVRSGKDQIDVLQKQLELQKQVTSEVEAQHRVTAELNVRTAEHQERTRVLSGKGTAQEQHDFGESQFRQHFTRESGPDAANDASGLISRAREIDSLTRGQGPQALAAYHDELHRILESILGLQENQHAELNSQRSQLSEFATRISNMESRSSNDRGFGH
jgi:hypothetical protein